MEKRYAQIEKEALNTTWAFDKFSEYILGRKFLIETDHKPLVPLLSTKNLNSLPPQILCFRLIMVRFHYSIVHVPGKTLCTADTLSRSPVDSQQATTLQKETETIVEAIVNHFAATESQLDKYQNAQKDDSLCLAIKEYSDKGWPSKGQITSDLKQYRRERKEFSICEDLLYDMSIVVHRSHYKSIP